MNLEFFQHIFKKFLNIKFHENPSSGSRVFPCVRADGGRKTDGRAGMTKLVVTFRNFAKPHKNCSLSKNSGPIFIGLSIHNCRHKIFIGIYNAVDITYLLQDKCVHIQILHFLKIYFIVILPSTPWCLEFSHLHLGA